MRTRHATKIHVKFPNSHSWPQDATLRKAGHHTHFGQASASTRRQGHSTFYGTLHSHLLCLQVNRQKFRNPLPTLPRLNALVQCTQALQSPCWSQNALHEADASIALPSQSQKRPATSCYSAFGSRQSGPLRPFPWRSLIYSSGLGFRVYGFELPHVG